MRISPVNFFNSISPVNQINRSNNLPQLKQDTVSFGYGFYDNADPDMQLYRSISESEYKKLISGNQISCAGYTTSDPRGWNATSWQNGYVCNHREPVYFVTFKTGVLPIDDRRDSELDTRYGFRKPYNLNDVKNIRKGSNAHGELVYSENFEQEKKNDIKNKLERIYTIEDILAETKDETLKSDLYDELSSYAQEFPQIIEDIEPYINYNSQADINDLLDIINSSNKKEHIELFRKCMNTVMNNRFNITYSALNYLSRNSEQKDIPLILDMLDNDLCNGYYAGNMLNNCVKEEDFFEIEDELLVPDCKKLLALTEFCKKRNNDGEHTQTIREILSTIDEMDTYIPFISKEDRYRSPIIEKCAQELAKHGDIEDISILEKFYNSETPTNYPDLEVNDAINEIKKKNQ